MKVHYEISMAEPATHYFRVRMQLEELGGRDKLRLMMPVWTPGSYLVREFARNVFDLEATTWTQRRLKVEKETKNTWTIWLEGAKQATIEYSVYAFVYSTNSSYLDTQHAVINGASTFLLVEGAEREKLSVSLDPHASWRSISTGLPRVPGRSNEFAAENYDILVDSPIEVGNQHVHSFEVQGVEHQVSIFSPKPIKEEDLVSDLKKIVESTIPIFGEVPYKRYVFLVDFGETATGGLEHLNSTLCIQSYYMMEPPAVYRRALTLFSHEFFHAWNVKRMRPAGLGPFNYSAEAYTRSLWVAEGLTSYYEAVILRRAKIFGAAEFLDDYCENVNYVSSFPSSKVMSPEESSFNAWICYYRPSENTPNTSPSYYWQGAALGGVLDLTIRNATAGERSLDDAMRRVYNQSYVKENRGYTEEEFEEACSAVSKGATGDIFQKHVRGREPVEFNEYLGYAGLTLSPAAAQATPEGYLGIKTGYQDGRVVVQHRLVATPAEECDLSAGDEVIAVDGLRVDGQKLPYYIANRSPGTDVSVLTAREGVVTERKTRLVAKPVLEYRIIKKESASAAEKSIFAGWTLESWDSPLQYADSKRSPVARRFLDYF